MAGASFLVGILPLSLSLSSRQLRLITALGTGVLVGTSLIVIIPEGIETLYEASGTSHEHAERSLRLAPRSTDRINEYSALLNHGQRWTTAEAVPINVGLPDEDTRCAHLTKRQESSPDDPQGDEPEEPEPTSPVEEPDADDDEAAHEERNPHAWVGVSLISGFILMYLIDSVPRHASTPSQPQRFAVSLNQFSLTRSRTSSIPETPTTSSSHQNSSTSRPSSTTVGLVIHACADGIALGASSTTTSRLSFIIFIALMIHKAPAAFGLTSVLLKQGLPKRAARGHLIVFSLAAPVGALLTWGAAHVLGYSSSTLGNSTSTEFATGILLLFSGGTFLYVAMHTMQEGSSHDHGEDANGQMNGYASVPMSDMSEMYSSAASAPSKKEAGGLVDMLVTVVGMLLPLLTQFGHAH